MYTAAVYDLEACVQDRWARSFLASFCEAGLWRNISPSPSSPLALLLCSTPLCPSFNPLPFLTFLCFTARKSKSQRDFLSGSHFGSNMLSLRSAAASCLALFLMRKNETRLSLLLCLSTLCRTAHIT